ncbi:hypothetical protein M885DRAFT_541148 [Pelagophyceae sp. CCMP2097]|nr:hypothetical protein M885DRAFT_541148 [Pelagophyceae sp. CCMP2097]
MAADQAALQRSVDEMLVEVDNKHLRPLRKTCFLAMAKCCDSTKTRETFNDCVQRAGVPEERAGAAVQQELQNFQQRIQRAAAQCQDDTKDKGFKDQDSQQEFFDGCVKGVFAKHAALLPAMKKRILASM